ncbi:YbaN family protein [Aerococcus mictus]
MLRKLSWARTEPRVPNEAPTIITGLFWNGADFEDGGGIPLKKKVQIILITYTVMAISIYFVPLKPVRLLIIVIGIIFGLWLFFKMPTKKE